MARGTRKPEAGTHVRELLLVLLLSSACKHQDSSHGHKEQSVRETGSHYQPEMSLLAFLAVTPVQSDLSKIAAPQLFRSSIVPSAKVP